MTRLSLYRRAVAVLLVLWLAALGWVLHSRYRADHPATTPYVAGKCTAAGLVGHWKFDEVAGGATPDAGPYGHHGRLALAPRAFAPLRFSPPALVPGPRGNALQFGGKQWVTAANNDCFATGQFTVAAWVWLEEAHGVPTIAAKSAASTDGWWLCTTSLGAQEAERYLDFGIAVGGGRIAHVKSGFQLPLREWHHVVASLDNTRSEAQFFIDGKPYGPKHTGVPKWSVNTSHDFMIGEYDGSARWPWRGKLADVRFYNYVLSADEARALFAPREPTVADGGKNR
jgi:hypothetical protein